MCARIRFRGVLQVCHSPVTRVLLNENLYRGVLQVCYLPVACALQSENRYQGASQVCTCVLQNENLCRGVLQVFYQCVTERKFLPGIVTVLLPMCYRTITFTGECYRSVTTEGESVSENVTGLLPVRYLCVTEQEPLSGSVTGLLSM